MRQGRNGFGLVSGLSAWLLLLAMPAALPAEEPAARLAANRALVLRYVEEVLSRGQLDHLEQMVSPGYTDSSPGAQDPERGPALVRAAQKRVRSLFPSISYQIDQLIAEEDKVVAR
ncbi:MAG TPA: ester cyclase, partial [Thermoanaerobaculia bacterium]|nr:ester cyclase [Thermoanaerobaculia bacterium]